MMTEKIKAIRALIAKARLKEAIQQLLILDNTEYNDIIRTLEARLATLKRKERMGIVGSGEANLERNKINAALLDTISEIEANPPKEKVEANPVDTVLAVEDKEGLEKVIGRNGLQDINWLKRGGEKADSVCKIHAENGDMGTGFLVEGGYIFTNNHVIGSAAMAQYSKVEFGYDNPEVASVIYELDHRDFFTSKELDYTRVKVKVDATKKQISDWGFLNIKTITPSQKDALIIIQHPQGKPKQIAFSDGQNSTWQHRLHYKVTTEPGSSGSPVFDIDWNVIALHHAGGDMRVNAQGETKYVNEGILFDFILKDLKKQGQTQTKEGFAAPKSVNKTSGPVKTLLVYNAKEEEYAKGIKQHLFLPIRQKKLTLFDIQMDIKADENSTQRREQELEAAELILVLISGYLYTPDTLDIALQVEEQVGTKRVIPIRTVPFDMEGTPFEKLKGLPSNNKSISEYDNTDKALMEIAQAIRRVID